MQGNKGQLALFFALQKILSIQEDITARLRYTASGTIQEVCDYVE
ncbi:MAG: hypothetical protein K0R18_3084, partial [Bacillales bacterium]|nr:hypothetical protein [Bacillales bacterium]